MNIPSAHSPQASKASEHVGRWNKPGRFLQVCLEPAHRVVLVLPPPQCCHSAAKAKPYCWSLSQRMQIVKWELSSQALDPCTTLEPALGVHKQAALCLPSFKAPKWKFFRNGPSLSPSTAETGPGVLWFKVDTCSLLPKLQEHNPREYLLPTAGTLQPELKTAIPPSETGQPVNSTSRNTLSSEFKGLRGSLSLLFGHNCENINIFQTGFQHVQLKMAATLAGAFFEIFHHQI